MPILSIRHLTRYRYRNPVALGEHRMMFRPREGHDQRILSCDVQISPVPARLRYVHDVFGNSVNVPDDRLKRYAAVESVYEKALATLQSTETEAQTKAARELSEAFRRYFFDHASAIQREINELHVPVGRPVRLRFVISDGDVYSFRFSGR